jgi:NADPH:quinone reductase-like Zn-dependent oxidoreductase
MKAIILTQFGAPEMLQLQEAPRPTVGEPDVLVRVRAAPIGIGDTFARNFPAISPGDFSMPAPLWLFARFSFGLRHPRVRILGSEFAGDVEVVGSGVTTFKTGDAVFGYREMAMGANAEFVCISESGLLAHKPANLSYEEAASVPYGALTAMVLLRKADLQPGQRVLINGASGGIGSYAVQLAKLQGAHVTGVCATPRVGLVRALGADEVIDYTQEDFTANGQTYDLILDVRRKTTFARCKASLTPSGKLVMASFKTPELMQMLTTSRGHGRKVICALASYKQADMDELRALMEAGHLRAIIDRCYPLEQAAAAHRYFESGQRTGHVVLTVA